MNILAPSARHEHDGISILHRIVPEYLHNSGSQYALITWMDKTYSAFWHPGMRNQAEPKECIAYTVDTGLGCSCVVRARKLHANKLFSI